MVKRKPSPVRSPETTEDHDPLGDDVWDLANRLVADPEIRKAVSWCDGCAARALALAAARIAQLHGLDIEELADMLNLGWQTSEDNPPRPPAEELH